MIAFFLELLFAILLYTAIFYGWVFGTNPALALISIFVVVISMAFIIPLEILGNKEGV